MLNRDAAIGRLVFVIRARYRSQRKNGLGVMRSLARKICIVLLASGFPAEAGAPLAPGKPAGVAKAQEQTSSVLIYAGALGIVAGSMALASSGGDGNGILGGTVTTGTINGTAGSSGSSTGGNGSGGNSSGGVGGTGSGTNGGGTGTGGSSSGNQGGQTSGAAGSVFTNVRFNCNCTINTDVSTVTTTSSTH
jgi:hypothetical protein